MFTIKNIINAVLNTGVTDVLTNQQVKKIRLVNGVALMTGSVLIVISIVVPLLLLPSVNLNANLWSEVFFTLPHEWNYETKSFMMLFDFVSGVILLTIIIFNYKKRYTTAAVVLCSTAIILSLCYYLLLNIFFCYIVLIPAIMPLVFFNEKKYYLTFTIINYCLSLAATLLIFHFSRIVEEYQLLPDQFVINLSAVYFVLFLIASYFKNENIKNEKKMEKQNSVLTLQTREIRRQHDELLNEKMELQDYKTKMSFELSLAKKIQKKMIPSRSPLENLSYLYKPMLEVGGDFFDFILFRGGDKIGIFISDVSGHGVPAAFITSMVKTGIYQSGSLRNDPAGLLTYLNDVLMDNTAGNFVTAFYGLYDKNKKEICYANAGHNNPFIVENEKVSTLSGGSIPLGILDNNNLAMANKTYENYYMSLQEKSRLVLYTDGLTETFNKDDRNWSFEDVLLDGLLLRLKSKTCDDFIEMTYEELKMFQGHERFEDDICMICLDIV